MSGYFLKSVSGAFDAAGSDHRPGAATVSRRAFMVAILVCAFFAAPANAQIIDRLFGNNADESEEAPVVESRDASPCPSEMIEIDSLGGFPDACGTGRYPAALEDSVSNPGPIIGTWDVEIQGADDIVGLLVAVGDGARTLSSYESPDPGAAFSVMAITYNVQGGAYAAYTENLSSSGGLNIQAPAWPATVSGRSSGNPNVLIGQWESGDEKGVAIWRKRPTLEIFNVKVRDAIDSGAGFEDKQYIYGRNVVRINRAHELSCGFGNSRGNCPTLNLTLTGRGFAGEHVVWMDPAHHMELWWQPSCSEGVETASWHHCGLSGFNQGAYPFPEGEVSMNVTLTIRNGVKPGPRTLWVDGYPIPIYLEIEGYPEPEETPELASLSVIDLDGNTVEVIEEDTAYWLEATYSANHPQEWVTVELPMANTSVQEVVLYKTFDGSMFSSEQFRVQPTAGEGESP